MKETLHVLMLNLKAMTATDLHTYVRKCFHRLPFPAFAPVFQDLFLFSLGLSSRFPLSPTKQNNNERQELTSKATLYYF